MIDDLPRHLAGLYGQRHGWPAPVSPESMRLYVGDEFCDHRLPHLNELDALIRLATENRWPVSFLTPPLSDQGIERCARLLDLLEQSLPHSEVVANDWGVLFFVKENYPSLQLAVGRLLNKGFKDPRLPDATGVSRFSAEAAELLDCSTFDFSGYQQMLLELQVSRLERDVMPYGDLKMNGSAGMNASIYFPFGYITTGRICWTASYNQPAAKKYRMSDGCRRCCNRMSFRLAHNSLSQQIYQSGNTVFYLYPAEKLDRLVSAAKQKMIRLIYQGFVI